MSVTDISTAPEQEDPGAILLKPVQEKSFLLHDLQRSNKAG